MKKNCLFLALVLFTSSFVVKSQVSFSLSASKCKNDTVLLVANTSSLANSSFTWGVVPSGAIFSTINSSLTSIIFQNTGNYTVSLFVSSGSNTSSAQNVVIVNPLPTINLTASSLTTCIIGNIIPNSKPITFNASGGLSYTWSPPNGSMTGGQNGPLSTYRPLTSTCFSVLGMDANGCKNQAVSCVSVLPRFTISAAPQNPTLCLGGTADEYIVLTASNPSPPASGLPASHKYFWSGGQSSGILTAPLSSSVAVAPSSSYTYTVEMVDSLGCISLPKLVPVFVQVCAGLRTATEKGNLRAFPNPVNDRICIYDENSDFNIEEIFVTNELGVAVNAKINRISKLNCELDFTGLSEGIYYVRIGRLGKNTVLKVIKQ